MSTRATGSAWEDAALVFLRDAGLRFVARNFHCRYGEIDLIMRDGDGIVFVEVRYRRNPAHGDGTVSVGHAKRGKLVRTAQVWLQAHPHLAQAPCRFDVIGCSAGSDETSLQWTRNAFDADTGAA